MSDPPMDEWEEEGALRAVALIAAGLPCQDFDRDVLPLLRRLTAAQLAAVMRVLGPIRPR